MGFIAPSSDQLCSGDGEPFVCRSLTAFGYQTYRLSLTCSLKFRRIGMKYQVKIVNIA